MSGLEVTQRTFAAALLDRSAPVPEGLSSRSGPRPPRRFGVYRNNVASALTEALAVRYPVVMRLVGEAFFRAMAVEFALARPPRSPVLIRYGAGFPDFISGFGPAAGVPCLAHVARLESAWWEAYHAAEAEPLAPEAFAALAPESLADARLAFHPSFGLVSAPFPVVAIWRTNTGDAEVRPVDLSVAEDALVVRPDSEVEIRRLPPGAHAFLSALAAGRSLGEAAALASGDPAFDLARNLAGLIEARIATDILP